MRIAYIAPYQGEALLRRRPIVGNLSLAGNVKIELIAELLQKRAHRVEIISQGEVIERRLCYYRAFSERTHADISIRYASCFPIRFVNEMWSSLRTLALFKRRHRETPFDLVLLYNLKLPQVVCGHYAMRHFRIPVVLEYEDDAFVDIAGKSEKGFMSRYYLRMAREILNSVSGGIGVSPHILSQLPASIPKILLRGVVGTDILEASKNPWAARKNRVVYCGTHYFSKGLEQLITAWKSVDLPGWELHIAGRGHLTERLQRMAVGCASIVFHGLLSREDLAGLLASTKICINPHDVSQTPGNVFAFKIIEYLAAGAHCITTPMGALEPDLESGITYIPDNLPQTIAAALKQVIGNARYERLAVQAVQNQFGPDAVAKALDGLLKNIVKTRTAIGADEANESDALHNVSTFHS
jgi:glycosyltransferase involved in cell wall biosynthesis